MKSSFTVCALLTFSISLLVYFNYFTPFDPYATPTHSHTQRWITSTGTRTVATCSPQAAAPTTLSHIVFSIAGSASTWDRRSHYSGMWWDPNSTRGFVWLDEPPPENYTWMDNYPAYRVIKFDPSRDNRESDRIARIAKAAFDELAARGEDEPEVRWFVMGDDDTVFFKENLVTVLSRYDHRRMWYIGGSSESVEQNELHSHETAFGGGGFAISYPLASQLAAVIEGCVRRYTNFYGSDEKISACVGELGVALTRESGFHQLDIKGNPYGLLAAHPVTPLVSLHHLEAVDPLFPHQTKLASLTTLERAYNLDPPRTLQQSICYSPTLKWSISVSWGYTVQLYPSLLTARELQLPLLTFKTWRSLKEGPFEFNTRSLKADPCDPSSPIFYFLDKVEEINGGNVTLSAYKKVVYMENEKLSCSKQSSSYKDASTVNEITVVASKMNPMDWLTVPQRQCCEISINRGWGWKRNVKVVVRSCKTGETISTVQ